MMELLAGRYGPGFMSSLHRGAANGLAAVDEALAAVDPENKVEVTDVLHDWALMNALDLWVDQGARIFGFPGAERVTAPTLRASVNWDNPDTHRSPGAPPNGADYVRLRDATGAYLTGAAITSLDFAGATTLPAAPIAWTVDADPPGQPGNPALYSGSGLNRDEGAVLQVAVPTGTPTLSFRARWNLEETWDFGYVQVSTDGGATYTSLPCSGTSSTADPGAVPEVVAQLPGYTGDSGGFEAASCPLAPYAGQTALLAFRTINDPAAEGQDPAVRPGLWIDDVTIGTTSISTGASLADWRSFSQVKPTSVAGFTVYVISMRDRNRDKIRVRQLPLTSGFTIDGQAKLKKFVDPKADFVAAVVIYDDPTELARGYAPYRLVVNDVLQPGGGMQSDELLSPSPSP